MEWQNDYAVHHRRLVQFSCSTRQLWALLQYRLQWGNSMHVLMNELFNPMSCSIQCRRSSDEGGLKKSRTGQVDKWIHQIVAITSVEQYSPLPWNVKALCYSFHRLFNISTRWSYITKCSQSNHDCNFNQLCNNLVVHSIATLLHGLQSRCIPLHI